MSDYPQSEEIAAQVEHEILSAPKPGEPVTQTQRAAFAKGLEGRSREELIAMTERMPDVHLTPKQKDELSKKQIIGIIAASVGAASIAAYPAVFSAGAAALFTALGTTAAAVAAPLAAGVGVGYLAYREAKDPGTIRRGLNRWATTSDESEYGGGHESSYDGGACPCGCNCESDDTECMKKCKCPPGCTKCPCAEYKAEVKSASLSSGCSSCGTYGGGNVGVPQEVQSYYGGGGGNMNLAIMVVAVIFLIAVMCWAKNGEAKNKQLMGIACDKLIIISGIAVLGLCSQAGKK